MTGQIRGGDHVHFQIKSNLPNFTRESNVHNMHGRRKDV